MKLFTIRKSNQPAQCRNCPKIIPSTELRLVFDQPAGVYTVVKHLCLNCLHQLLSKHKKVLTSREFDVDKLVCPNCGNIEDFTVHFETRQIVHAVIEKEASVWELPQESITEIICLKCDTELDLDKCKKEKSVKL